MYEKKILSFLNIDLKKGIDKFTMKLLTWFNVGFSVFVFGGGALLQLISFSWFDCIALFLCVILNIFLFITIKVCKKNTDEWFHYLSVLICSILILFYGWFIFSKGEFVEFGYPKFGWMHIAVLFAALILGGYIMLKFYWVYKITVSHTLEEAQAILQSKSKNAILIPATFAFSPMILVRLFRGPFSDMGLGIGFGLWSLMCIWLVLVSFIIPKVIVILKYKVYLW